jgi:N-glycosylase/DNA lyase
MAILSKGCIGMDIPAPHGLTALKFLWDQCRHTSPPVLAPEEIWLDEFFFCLLGGYGIPFELNKSTFSVLKTKGYFEPSAYRGHTERLENRLESELKTRQFNPLCKDGSFRAYRFPKSKAKTLVKAGQWLLRTCDFCLSDLLASTSKKSRETLLECPGVGYKTASWFLRNIGQGNGLAILDIHIYRTLKDLAIIPPTLTVESDYLEIEDFFCSACDAIGARIESMDLILWTWARGDVYERRHHLSAS